MWFPITTSTGVERMSSSSSCSQRAFSSFVTGPKYPMGAFPRNSLEFGHIVPTARVIKQFTASEVGYSSVHLDMKSVKVTRSFAPRLPWRRHIGVA